MPDGQMKPEERQPFLMVAFGRQRVGTTTLLNAVAQYWRDHGNSIRVWDADCQNRIQALRHVFPDAEVRLTEVCRMAKTGSRRGSPI